MCVVPHKGDGGKGGGDHRGPEHPPGDALAGGEVVVYALLGPPAECDPNKDRGNEEEDDDPGARPRIRHRINSEDIL